MIFPSTYPPAVGLSSDEASARLAADGPNEIVRAGKTSAWVILGRQFTSPFIWLLLVASGLSLFLGDSVDAIAIGAIVVLNAIVGFLQEHRAEKAIFALRAMTAPRARVVRDGTSVVIPAGEVVVGDRLLLEAGDVVAADAHLGEAHALMLNEAALTGESESVRKTIAPVSATAPLAERKDSVFMGTPVVAGTGAATVVATGMRTELGKIAHLLATADDAKTPLEQRLAGLGRVLLGVCLTLVFVTAAVGLLRGTPWVEVVLGAVSLAVATVPEGLPAIVTVALALGVQRMATRHVLVRRLAAVESLGSATVICTDKTGTLTTGIMTVRELHAPDERRLLDAAAACCDAEVGRDGEPGTGDPMEIAILAAASEKNIHRNAIEQERPRRAVNPFDSVRKRMSILREDGVLYVKGALESILPLCKGDTLDAVETTNAMASRGLRVLAVALGSGTEEKSLELVGLIGLSDPPREEAIAAVRDARDAGIRTVMITGDHPITAGAIARELGIVRAGEDAKRLVHARATPEDKIRIVREWKAQGAVVAMTGDGVNDAPALKEAHVGIAMGRTGTEVTREAADVVLTDDNFASIVAGVREGRGIFDNIRKALVYLLTGNAAELLVMLTAAIAGWPAPLLPLHLLWINLVTDALPALALVTDPIDGDVLRQPPRKLDEAMLRRVDWVRVFAIATIEAAVTLGVFLWALREGNVERARDLAFTTLVFAELFRSFAARSPVKIFWEVGAFTNLRLLAVVVLSAVFQVVIHEVPFTQNLFRTTNFGPADYGIALSLGLIPVTALELFKLVRRAWCPSESRLA